MNHILTFLLSVAVSAVILQPMPLSAQGVFLPNFSDVSSLTLNGSAAQAGNRLRLTPDLHSQAGSAFQTSPVTLGPGGSFSTHFSFRISNGGDCSGVSNASDPSGDGIGADGIAFIVQNDASMDSALGGTGGAIGYGGITPSLTVEFDSWENGIFSDPDGNHIGLNFNGNVVSSVTVPLALPPRLNDLVTFFAWIDYDGNTDVIEVRLSQSGVRPAAPTLALGGVDLAGILGGTTAYVGFSSGTGAACGNHDILSWRLGIGNLPSMSRVCVSQEAIAGGADDFTFLGLADVFNRSLEPAASVYAYNFPLGASYNGFPPPSISNVSQLFVVDTNDGAGSSLFIVHDTPLDGTGGTADMRIDLLGGDTASAHVRDDPAEAIVDVGGLGTQFMTNHQWVACCTDGGVVGTFEGPWIADAQFVAAPTGLASWQVTSADSSSIPLVGDVNRRARLHNCADVGDVIVDLKPLSNPNCFKDSSGGVISVAIMTTPEFDATTVDPATVTFGGAPATRCSIEDSGADEGFGDGDLDLVCKFNKKDVSGGAKIDHGAAAISRRTAAEN